MSDNVTCQGFHCPVRMQCANFARNSTAKDGRMASQIAQCTNQKKFIKKDL